MIEEYIHPPSECRFCTEDLECLGCGVKIGLLKQGECGYVNWVRQKRREQEDKERAEYQRLKLKYEGGKP